MYVRGSGSSDSSSDEKRPAARRRRRKRKDETLASKLIHNKAVALDPSGGEDGVQSPEGGGWVHASMRTLFSFFPCHLRYTNTDMLAVFSSFHSAKSSDDTTKPVRAEQVDSSPSPPPLSPPPPSYITPGPPTDTKSRQVLE